ncbi:50S ribosomal protein L24 [Sedimentibacter sp. MB31-C6]|uniref:50S ribosomal protein L24 n=1 Tax=Sedimentibacter sp. MB31-C6 TaxID=3109366 RepID=UPI002DDD1E6E|nr:50S ribosomal protein L24 [Sedimentibacter sp. MB36-C1]WSI03868.1 50S ribosomal protein L24 [Sedimentibacter sp. MB36-C1]
MHVKKGDKVVVIAGSDKGKTGKILSSLPKLNRVIVEGVNMVTKHQKATREMQQAGILHREGAIDASNVMIYCDKCKSGVRTEIKINNGKKVRACKKCGQLFE